MERNVTLDTFEESNLPLGSPPLLSGRTNSRRIVHQSRDASQVAEQTLQLVQGVQWPSEIESSWMRNGIVFKMTMVVGNMVPAYYSGE